MRIVAKIGTASVTDERGRISHEAIAKLPQVPGAAG